jgi:hypothetical protein
MSEKKQVTYRVKLEGSDGKSYVESFEQLRKDLGIDGVRDYLLEQIRIGDAESEFICERLKPQLLEAMQPEFKAYLAEWKTKSFHCFQICRAFNNAKNVPRAFRNLVWDLFDDALVLNLILSKGHGWYRAAKVCAICGNIPADFEGYCSRCHDEIAERNCNPEPTALKETA